MIELVIINCYKRVLVTPTYVQFDQDIDVTGNNIKVVKCKEEVSSTNRFDYNQMGKLNIIFLESKCRLIFGGDFGDLKIVVSPYIFDIKIEKRPSFKSRYPIEDNIDQDEIFNIPIESINEELEFLGLTPSSRLFSGAVKSQLAHYHKLKAFYVKFKNGKYIEPVGNQTGIVKNEIIDYYFMLSNFHKAVSNSYEDYLKTKGVYTDYLPNAVIKTSVKINSYPRPEYTIECKCVMLAMLQYEHEYDDIPRFIYKYPVKFDTYGIIQAFLNTDKMNEDFLPFKVDPYQYMLQLFKNKQDIIPENSVLLKLAYIMNDDKISNSLINKISSIDKVDINRYIKNKVQRNRFIFHRTVDNIDLLTPDLFGYYSRYYGIIDFEYKKLITNIPITRDQLVQMFVNRDSNLIHYDVQTVKRIIGMSNVNEYDRVTTFKEIKRALLENRGFSISTNVKGCQNVHDNLYNDFEHFVITYGPLTNNICYSMEELTMAFEVNSPSDYSFRRPERPNIIFTFDEVKGLFRLLEQQDPTRIPTFIDRIIPFMTKIRPTMSVRVGFNINNLLTLNDPDKEIMKGIMIALFETGMYQRTWKGPGHPYVYMTNDTRGSSLDVIESMMTPGIAKIRIEMDKLSNSGINILETLPTIYKFKPLSIGADYLWNFLVQTAKGNYCIGVGSSYMIETALKYLDILNYSIENFDYDRFEKFSQHRIGGGVNINYVY